MRKRFYAAAKPFFNGLSSFKSRQNWGELISSDNLDISDFCVAGAVIIGQIRRLQVATGVI